MKPQRLLDKLTTPDGYKLVLYERAGVWSIRVNGYDLMSSWAHGSEEALATLACDRLSETVKTRVLIGGLGMGFTLRAALDCLPPDARVVVAEVFPAVVRWNREHFGHLTGRPLDDPRVEILEEDVASTIRKAATEPFDLIMLDVDNGPEALTLDRNEKLYGRAGIDRLHTALVPRGTLAVWSASPDPGFAALLGSRGFVVRTESVRAHSGKGMRHAVFLAVRRA